MYRKEKERKERKKKKKESCCPKCKVPLSLDLVYAEYLVFLIPQGLDRYLRAR